MPSSALEVRVVWPYLFRSLSTVPLWEVRGRRNIVQVSITPKYSTSCTKFRNGDDAAVLNLIQNQLKSTYPRGPGARKSWKPDCEGISYHYHSKTLVLAIRKKKGGPDRSGGYYYFHRSCVHIPVPRYGRTRVAHIHHTKTMLVLMILAARSSTHRAAAARLSENQQ